MLPAIRLLSLAALVSFSASFRSGVRQALALRENLLFQITRLALPVLVDQCLDRAFIVGLRVGELEIEAARNFEFDGIVVALFLKLGELAQRNPDAGLADEPLPA